MIEADKETLKKDNYLLYIHTPFCGTCHYAKRILEDIENTFNREVFYDINSSFHPDFMQEEKIESVPCLVIKEDGEVKEKIYTFHSVPFMVKEVMFYPDLII